MAKWYIDTYMFATFGGISFGGADMLLVDRERADWVQLKSQMESLHLISKTGTVRVSGPGV
jgi:hypothetical protein